MKYSTSFLIICFVLFFPISMKGNISDKKPEKPALIWFDAEANFARFSNSDSIDYYFNKIKSLGLTHAILDMRPITGKVLFDR